MTTEQSPSVSEQSARLNFAARSLPWFIALATFIIYLLTLNHWVTLRSLPVAAKIAGWDWRPTTLAPLHFLLTLPIRALSGNVQLLALNVFSAICAALTMALLARSIAILPQDRTREQRQRELGKFGLLDLPNAWLAPVIAVLACGLQLTFWENAIAGTGEMLDLLLFAFVIRCLLEYRLSNRESYIAQFAFVYGLAITNNWAMIGFLPFFIIALIWIKGGDFFDFKFLSRLAGFGVLGLLLYFLLPIVAIASKNSDQGFLAVLKENLRNQKTYLSLPFVQVAQLRSRLFVMALTSLLPLLMIGIRWPSFRGDVSAAGTAVTAFMFRVMHLFFLGACLWVFFDPKFSARSLGFELAPYLTFYYLSALCVGYFIGYVLLVFGRKPVQSWARSTGISKVLEPIVLGIVCIGIVLAPIALARKNLPLVQAGNSGALQQFSKSMAQSLPPKNALVLSDDTTRLYLLKAFYQQAGTAPDNILVDTGSLPFPDYNKVLGERHPQDWPTRDLTNRLSDFQLLQHLVTLSQSRPIYYLHPSFGYYFEAFYPIPHNLVYELKLYPTNVIQMPPLSAAVIAENQSFWTAFNKDSLPQLAGLGRLSSDVRLINTYYSRALNYWGTKLQKAKMLNEAAAAFANALVLNPDNAVAEVNQQFNANLRKGEIRPVELTDSLQKNLSQYRDVQTALTWNGPFDTPEFDLQLGEEFARGGNLRQSAQYFMRTLDFMPNNFGARLGLAKTEIEMRRPDDALKLISEIRKDPKTLTLNTNATLELLRVESLAYLAKNDLPTAEKILTDAVQQHPKDEARLALLSQLYLDVGKYTNALETVQKQLALAPNNAKALFAKAVLQMQLGQFAPAVQTLDEVLKLEPDNNNALLNRAIANLQSGKLDDAKRDYETLRDTLPNGAYQIDYGLAKIAEKQNDKSAALKNYKAYLKHGPVGTAEYTEVQNRVNALEK